MNEAQRSRGKSRLAAARNARLVGRKCGRLILPAQDVQLVTQDRDLDLLGGDGRTSATASTDQPAEHEIEDGPDHGAKMVPIRCPPRRIGLLAPFKVLVSPDELGIEVDHHPGTILYGPGEPGTVLYSAVYLASGIVDSTDVKPEGQIA